MFNYLFLVSSGDTSIKTAKEKGGSIGETYRPAPGLLYNNVRFDSAEISKIGSVEYSFFSFFGLYVKECVIVWGE